MKTIKLSNRLAAAASFVEKGARIADVGTDHGYIPVYMAQTGIAAAITASDLREGPLENARLSAGEYGVSDKINFILCDGLEGIGPDTADTVIIAGMGGETIRAILQKAEWTKTPGLRLILQPQSKIEELCLWLAENGYAVRDGKLAEEDGKIYLVMLASFDAEGGPEADIHGLRALMARRDPLAAAYLRMLISKGRRALEGMERGSAPVEEELDALKERIEYFERLRREVTW